MTEFSLTKAQKLLTKLKSYIDKNRQKETDASSYFVQINDFILVQDKPDTILENINQRAGNLVDRLNNYITIYKDYCNFKTAIHSVNTLVKLDHLLTEIDCLQNTKKIYESLVTHADTIPNLKTIVSIDHIKFLHEETSNMTGQTSWKTNVNNFLSTFSMSELETKIKTINKELDSLETCRDHLNAVSKVLYVFSNVTNDILGLDQVKK